MGAHGADTDRFRGEDLPGLESVPEPGGKVNRHPHSVFLEKNHISRRYGNGEMIVDMPSCIAPDHQVGIVVPAVGIPVVAGDPEYADILGHNMQYVSSSQDGCDGESLR